MFGPRYLNKLTAFYQSMGSFYPCHQGRILLLLEVPDE